jgi:NAD(P)-dependent dehydrogenase (short-subunit alcohol dehydrogenase family)
MDIDGHSILIMGGSGLVGMAVARELLAFHPKTLVISALRQDEAESAVRELRQDAGAAAGITIEPAWGNLLVPQALKDRPRDDVLADDAARGLLLDDLYGELTDAVVRRSALGVLLDRTRPHIVIDCINTATTFAYQNVFDSAIRLRDSAAAGTIDAAAVEHHLASLYLPQLIRHVQIALDSMRRADTRMYIKVGTSGTGGMGLNIPFTHSEERPSRMLLAKSGVAGAHTLLLYLMARTPGAPAVKEIKPCAAISWKRIGFGPILKGGKSIPCFDAAGPVPLPQAFADGMDSFVPGGCELAGVFLDAGENGLFSLGEFEALTALGLMEYITPEEIADDVLREIRGHPSGHDVVAALDAASAGPTYRAGVLREVALDRMERLERAHGVQAVAYEMLGPPRLSKLLFEGTLLARLFRSLEEVAGMDPYDTGLRCARLIEQDRDLRMRILSIGLPILLPDGQRLLRGRDVKVAPEPGQPVDDARLAENGWVDLRPANWRKWSDRVRAMLRESEPFADGDTGSRADTEPDERMSAVRPGRMAAWVFRHEDRGARIKR